eukprot:1138431-Pyramimonas_sp.AAC.1
MNLLICSPSDSMGEEVTRPLPGLKHTRLDHGNLIIDMCSPIHFTQEGVKLNMKPRVLPNLRRDRGILRRLVFPKRGQYKNVVRDILRSRGFANNRARDGKIRENSSWRGKIQT